MAEVKVMVCDKCGMFIEAPKVWAIHTPTETITLDLCEEHHTALDEAIRSVIPKRAPRKAMARKDFESRSLTIEEIEALRK